MKKIIALIIIIALIGTLLMIKFMSEKVETENYGEVPVHKMWTLKYDQSLDPASVNDETVSVKDSQGKKIDINIDLIMDNRWITVAPKTPYTAKETYTLYVSSKIKDSHGKRLKQARVIRFTASDSIQDKLVLAWDYADSAEENKRHYDEDKDYIRQRSEGVGIGIVSPTWFNIKWQDKKFEDMIEITDTEYLKIAQENGYKVWPCFQVLPDRSIFDSIKEYAAKVHEMLTDEATTDAIICRLVNYSRQYGFKGINVDFEAMGKMNREAYTAFMKKLSQEFHKNGIAVSVDVTEPMPNSMYSECYDILELSKQVDYMMFMAYDEHYSGGESGSVGSHDWVEGGIKKFLSAGVPSDKLVLGVPFYMRDFAVIEVDPTVDSVVVTKMATGWVQPKLYDQPSKDSAAIKSCIYGDTFAFLSMQDHWCQVGYEGKNAYIEKSVVRQVKANEKKKFTVGSFEATSKRIEKILNDQEAEVSIGYDPVTRQDVLTYYKFERDNSVKLKHEIWLENEKSMQWRVQLAEKYDLKGLAAWQLSHATDEMLSVLKKYKR